MGPDEGNEPLRCLLFLSRATRITWDLCFDTLIVYNLNIWVRTVDLNKEAPTNGLFLSTGAGCKACSVRMLGFIVLH